MSSGREVWISIAATERPVSLQLLADDLSKLAREAQTTLRVFVIENGRTEAARRATVDAVAALRGEAHVEVELSTTAGGSIARSRRDQREQVRRALSSSAPPEFIWMLDDDVRLEHQVLENGNLCRRRLHNHLSFLFELRARRPTLEVLLGEVTGDPPIPPVATFASRLEDFLASLRCMGGMSSSAHWEVRPTGSLGALCDDYYDFGRTADAPTPRLWTASRSGLVVTEALEAMLLDACDIPFGISFSRPILANANEFSRLRAETTRGAHAVFFSPEAFLSQRYASVTLEGVESRRSDTVASALFARSHRGGLYRSAFSVLHVRPRDERALPTSEELARNLIADTWGAALTRALEHESNATAPFLVARLKQIESTLCRIASAIDEVRRLALTIPAWARRCRSLWEHLDARLQWMLDTVRIGHEGRLAPSWRSLLADESVADALGAFARRLKEDPNAE